MPERKGDDGFKYMDKKRRDAIKGLRESRTAHALSNLAYRTLHYSRLLFHPDNDYRKFLFERKYRVGMLEHSIFGNPILIPSEDGLSLSYETAPPGRWAAYDFHRRSELGKDVKDRGKGRIFCFLIEEVKHNSKNKYTPTYMLDILDFEHVIHLEFPNIEYLEKNGLVEQATYQDAFKRAGAYEKYASGITSLGIGDRIIYQVTPKGNGLVFLSPDTGKPVERRKESGILVPVLKPSF